MSYVVVIKGKDCPLAVHKGKDLVDLLRRLHRRYAPRRGKWFGPKADAFITANYNTRMSAAQIADELSKLRKRPITKNMVVSRARSLGIGSRRRSTLNGHGG